MKFNSKEKEVLKEIDRRLNIFHDGDLDTRLLLLALPYEVKSLINKKILTCSTSETPRVFNWYRLTEAGKQVYRNKRSPSHTS